MGHKQVAGIMQIGSNWYVLMGKSMVLGYRYLNFEKHPEFEDYWNVYQYMAMGQKVWYSVEH
jgi:hypothetical protein